MLCVELPTCQFVLSAHASLALLVSRLREVQAWWFLDFAVHHILATVPVTWRPTRVGVCDVFTTYIPRFAIFCEFRSPCNGNGYFLQLLARGSPVSRESINPAGDVDTVHACSAWTTPLGTGIIQSEQISCWQQYLFCLWLAHERV